MDKFTKKHRKDFYVVAIQYDTNIEQLKKTLAEKKYHFDMLVANDAVFIDYRITSTPTIMLLDQKNFILKNKDGVYLLEKLFIQKEI